MKNKTYALISAVILLAVLLCVYMFVSGRNDETEDASSQTTVSEETGNRIVEGKETDSFSVSNSNGEFEFVKKGDDWSVRGYSNTFDSSVISSMAGVFESLYTDRVIEGEDLAKYGLADPSATATDGKVTINVGTVSTDGKYYYVSLDDGKEVYMVNSARIQPLLCSFNDIIDKSVEKIDTNSIQELSIDYADDSANRDIYIIYEEDNPLAREYSEKNGLAALVMQKPVKNMLVYPYNLQSSVLRNSDYLNITELADIKPENLGKYGLDKPKYTINISDKENSIKVVVGNTFKKDEDEFAYVLVNDRPEVFTMNQIVLNPFENAKIADFAEKFISIYQRSKVKEIDIEGAENYKIEFKSEGENDYRTEDGVTRDYRNTYINGKPVDKDLFTDFYELIVGIGFDEIEYNKKPEGEPYITITFTLTDGSSDKAEYYKYNNNFYAVTKGGDNIMYVSDQTVRRVLNKAKELAG